MAWRQHGGMAKPRTSEPERVQPVPENYEGVNFPYRGTNKHGVEVPDNAEYDTREFQHEVTEDWSDEALEAPEEAEPVAVRVVNKTAREVLTWQPVRFRVTDQPQRILGKHDRRRNVRIRNSSETSSTETTNDDTSGTLRVTTQSNLTGSGNTAEYVIPATGWDQLAFGLNITSITGTTPSVTVKIQETIDGTNWVDLLTYSAATAAGYQMLKTPVSASGAPSNRVRVSWTTSGTITDLDFTVDVMRFPVERTTTETVTVSGGKTVYLGNDSSVKAYTGYHLPSGSELYPFVSTQEVWAVCASGEESDVFIMAETSVEL